MAILINLNIPVLAFIPCGTCATGSEYLRHIAGELANTAIRLLCGASEGLPCSHCAAHNVCVAVLGFYKVSIFSITDLLFSRRTKPVYKMPCKCNHMLARVLRVYVWVVGMCTWCLACVCVGGRDGAQICYGFQSCLLDRYAGPALSFLWCSSCRTSASCTRGTCTLFSSTSLCSSL